MADTRTRFRTLYVEVYQFTEDITEIARAEFPYIIC